MSELPFDDGEIRILRILIREHRKRVLNELNEARLDEVLSQVETEGDGYGQG